MPIVPRRLRSDGLWTLPLRSWLLAHLDHKTMPGAKWLDKTKYLFQLPWLHGSSRNWTEDSNRLFEEWAKETGKHQEGENPKRWKANLRCAMNSLKDIKEVKDKSNVRGIGAFKVFRFTSLKTVKAAYKKLTTRRPDISITPMEEKEEEEEREQVVPSSRPGPPAPPLPPMSSFCHPGLHLSYSESSHSDTDDSSRCGSCSPHSCTDSDLPSDDNMSTSVLPENLILSVLDDGDLETSPTDFFTIPVYSEDLEIEQLLPFYVQNGGATDTDLMNELYTL